MREIRQSGSEGGARFHPSSLPLSHVGYFFPVQFIDPLLDSLDNGVDPG